MNRPKLRFPEFRGAGEWEERKFSEISVLYKGREFQRLILMRTEPFHAFAMESFIQSMAK